MHGEEGFLEAPRATRGAPEPEQAVELRASRQEPPTGAARLWRQVQVLTSRGA